MCSAAKVMFVVIAADGWSYWQNERGRMGCPDWDALQWAFSAEQSIGHGRSQQPPLQERGGGGQICSFMQRCYYVQHCKVNVGGTCCCWVGLLIEWGALQWAFSAEQSIGHGRS